jgi:hypothetical protein
MAVDADSDGWAEFTLEKSGPQWGPFITLLYIDDEDFFFYSKLLIIFSITPVHITRRGKSSTIGQETPTGGIYALYSIR